MARPVHFELNADDPERAAAFYSRVFGWEIRSFGGPVEYWLITTGAGDEPGIDGALRRRKDAIRDQKTINTISVPSVDEYLERISTAGGKVLMKKWPIRGIGWAAYCEDTEGTAFGIMEEDPDAH